MKSLARFVLVCFAVVSVAASYAVDVDDVLILDSIKQVTVGSGGLMVNADDVVLRERRGSDYSLGKIGVQITSSALPGCLEMALRASESGRFVIRIRENAFANARGTIKDKLVVSSADLKSCAFSK